MPTFHFLAAGTPFIRGVFLRRNVTALRIGGLRIGALLIGDLLIGDLLIGTLLIGVAGTQSVAQQWQAVGNRADRAVRRVSAEGPAETAPVAGEFASQHGQVWRDYDIRVFSDRQAGQQHPEQEIVDWILRETGTQLWFSEPLGALTANRNRIRVYHTPEVQRQVEDMINRFVNGTAAEQGFGVQLMTLINPGWRTELLPRLRPVTVQTPGVQAWLVTKEDAAVLLASLRQRADFREHNSPQMLIQNGQSHVIQRTRPLMYVRGILPRTNLWSTGFDLETGQVEEGFTLEINPLLTTDGQHIDAVVKVETSYVEKLTPVHIEMPAPNGTRQSTQIQVPQTASWRLHERFHWPAEEVLLISCGLVANPGPERKNGGGLAGALLAGPSRAEALVMLEAKGRLPVASVSGEAPIRTGGLNYRGRY